MHRTTGALATKPRAIALAERPPLADASNLSGAVQGSLFSQNVIAMPNRVAPARPAPRTKTAATTTTGGKAAARRQSRVAEGQGELEFLAPVQPKARTLGTTVEAMIYCEAPVATPLHRALAAALDGTMVLIGFGLFLLTFVLCGGEFVFDRLNLIVFSGALFLIAVSYGVFWIIAGTESVGMRWTHLRLITFDGFPPETKQRVLRLAGSCLSLFTVLGALWALADEEGLGWQDHMSRTFPTAHELESRVFRRR